MLLIMIIIINTIIIYIASKIYSKIYEVKYTTADMFKIVIIFNLVTIIPWIIFYKLFPDNKFRDIFSLHGTSIFVNSGEKYLPNIGESIYTGNPPFHLSNF